MKLAIHHLENSFSERWIQYCQDENIDYKLVNCLDNNIIKEVEDCDALLWNWYNGDYKTKKFAKALTQSLEAMGLIVFPNSKTSWHYDDKIGQKYLLEAIGAPFIKTYIFYSLDSANEWIKKTKFPKVFKLSSGSGANGVQLIHNKQDAFKIVKQAFSTGFSPFNRFVSMKDKFKAFVKNKSLKTFYKFIKSCGRLFVKTEVEIFACREIGYAYFQEFIPNNDFDIRIVTVGTRAFAIKRYCRQNDFRASGSGIVEYEKLAIDERCVEIALEVSKQLSAQSLAYDFVFDANGTPLIIEISYTYTMRAYDSCQGFWDENMVWHEGSFNPQIWMIEDIIDKVKNKL